MKQRNTWRRVLSELELSDKQLKNLSDVLDIQGSDGNWNYKGDPNYMTGMYNGMELMDSIVDNRDPKFKDVPKKASLKLSWEVQEEVPEDTRNLFKDFCSVKPPTFNETRKANFNTSMTKLQQAALLSKPRIESNDLGIARPLEDFIAPPDGVKYEFILVSPNGRNFYVNTEGSTYCRYVFEIIDLPNKEEVM